MKCKHCYRRIPKALENTHLTSNGCKWCDNDHHDKLIQQKLKEKIDGK